VLWRGIGVNYEGGILDAPARAAVHITHRIGALVASAAILWLCFLAWRARLRSPAAMLAGCLCVQVALGISNVVYALPLKVAVAHNAVAALLVLALMHLWWRNRQAHASGIAAL
jgi:heme a synthase